MLDTSDSQCQIQVESVSATIQTCLPECSSTSCQTMAPTIASVSSQTKVPALSNLGAQTDMSMASNADKTIQTNITLISHVNTAQTEQDKKNISHLGAHVDTNHSSAASNPLQTSNSDLTLSIQRGNATKSCQDTEQEHMRSNVNDILFAGNDVNRPEESSNSSVLQKPNISNGGVAEIQSHLAPSHISTACIMGSSNPENAIKEQDNLDDYHLPNLDKKKCTEDTDQRNLSRDCSEGHSEMSGGTIDSEQLIEEMNLRVVGNCAKESELKKDPVEVLDGNLDPCVLNRTSMDLNQYPVDDVTNTTKVQNLYLNFGDNRNDVNNQENESRCPKETGMLSNEQKSTPQNKTDKQVITGHPKIKVTSESVPVTTLDGGSKVLDLSIKHLLESNEESNSENRSKMGRLE